MRIKGIESFGEYYLSQRDIIEFLRELQDNKEFYPDEKVKIKDLIIAFKGIKHKRIKVFHENG